MSIYPYYQGNNISLYQGDCLDVLPCLPAKFDMLLTDPPYMIGASSIGSKREKSGQWTDMMNASLWYATWLSAVRGKLQKDATGYVFTNWRSIPTLFKAMFDSQIRVMNTIVWNKEWIGPAPKTQLRPLYELILYFAQGEKEIKNRSATDIICCKWQAGAMRETEHSAEKPIPLLEKLILHFSETQYIIDPFAGSGTTAIAAIKTEKRAVLIENDERYCEIAAKRIESFLKND